MDKSGHQQLHQKVSACWVTSEVIWSAPKKALAGNASCEQEEKNWKLQLKIGVVLLQITRIKTGKPKTSWKAPFCEVWKAG